jgi:preprotein translocase subunit SecG
MYGVLIFLHLLVSVVLVLVVLMQQPQKGGMASILGGGESIFGGGGAAPFMAKLTAGVAVAFMVTSLSLVLIAAQHTRPAPAQRSAPTQQSPAPQTPSPNTQSPMPGGN